MTLPSSGIMKLSMIQGEFGGPNTPQQPISVYTRNGLYVPDNVSTKNIKTINSNMKWSDYYGAYATQAVEVVIYAKDNGTSKNENINAKTLFDSQHPGAWSDSTQDKQLTIESGAIIGATGASNIGMTIPSGVAGSLKVVNNGSIYGFGGVISGENGGTALKVSSNVTMTNNGEIYGGGGAGGIGGKGGDGDGYDPTCTVTGMWGPARCPDFTSSCRNCNDACHHTYDHMRDVPEPWIGNQFCQHSCFPTTPKECQVCGVRHACPPTTISGPAGGNGGSNGRGRGYNYQTGSLTGAAGSSGAPKPDASCGNAGNGGSGGSGGNWGEAGRDGSKGADGTSGVKGGGGSGGNGANGGTNGYAIEGIAFVTLVNNGSALLGGTL
jgi:hypothetical protein